MKEAKVVACNYAVATNTSRKGGLCYLLVSNPGNGNERIRIISRSRGGRWIDRWERIDRLTNFRLKTVMESDPLYSKLVNLYTDGSPASFEMSDVAPLQFAELRDKIARLANMRPSWPGCGFEPKGVPR